MATKRHEGDRRAAVWKAMAIGVALGLACSSGDSGGGTGGSGAGGSGAGGGGSGGSNVDAGTDPNVVVGAFVVTLVAASQANGEVVPGFTSVSGKVGNGAEPELTIWTLVEEAGGCKLLTPKQPSCIPTCAGGKACVADNTCVPYPTAIDVGKVHVKGLGSSEFDLESVGGNYLAPASVSLPNPPAPEGTQVVVTAAGGTLGALSLQAKVIAPLVVPAGDLHPVKDQPLALTWTAPGQGDLARIAIKVDLSHHGGIKGKIECNVPDTGSLQIPAAQITKLLGLGVSGFPTVSIDRVATGSVATRLGRVQLQITSPVERDVKIDGLTSCTKNEDCPPGKTCAVDYQCK